IESFRERIQINGTYISEEDLAKELEPIRQLSDHDKIEHPTEFELITALAFAYFKHKQCDVIVLEVGLGGRFDATNVIDTPLASVITSISLDHTEILGDTIAKIAYEKCGIIKRNGVTITAPGQHPDALHVIQKTCSNQNNSLFSPELKNVKILSETIEGTTVLYNGQQLRIPLCGRHQICNFLTAFEVLSVVSKNGLPLSLQTAISGMEKVTFPARMECLCKEPLVLVDGAHNPAGISALADSIKRFFPNQPITVIMGILADKDYAICIQQIASLSSHFIALEPQNPRALALDDIRKIAEKYAKHTIACKTYQDALDKAYFLTRKNGAILICGSLYLAGPMRTLFQKK
ncbi:MAG TPA: bifunctional folylpolyglutamate synthase/dihydrofolate synthase, partial [Ruminococcaceae bacterium]|nr:bifunctional folylpolyglutamate synthase/dihydrofolate synthase [Oscillospiraceae bacterium]